MDRRAHAFPSPAVCLTAEENEKERESRNGLLSLSFLCPFSVLSPLLDNCCTLLSSWNGSNGVESRDKLHFHSLGMAASIPPLFTGNCSRSAITPFVHLPMSTSAHFSSQLISLSVLSFHFSLHFRSFFSALFGLMQSHSFLAPISGNSLHSAKIFPSKHFQWYFSFFRIFTLLTESIFTPVIYNLFPVLLICNFLHNFVLISL